MAKKIRIGDLLLQHQIISVQQLDEAIAQQQKVGGRLGNILIELGYITEEKLHEVLAHQLQIPFIDLDNYLLNHDLIRKLPEIYARRFRAIIIEESGDEFLVGMVDPLDIFAFDELSRLLDKQVKQALVRESALLQYFDLVYSHEDEISGFAEELSEELSGHEIDLTRIGDEASAESPVAKLVKTLFEDAIQSRTSDIHIEPDEKALRIRQRIDGVLREQIINDTRIASALIQRLKLMAGLDISEKRLPQDGRFNHIVRGKNIDVRVATMPIEYGESMVMRLLDQSNDSIGLDKNGMPDPLLQRFRHLIHQPNGVILVTGPTGSGKTTTLYGALGELNQSEKKIITVEDPVEYHLPRINQVQVNKKIELGFARILRSVLRQDPDIIMVGEIRDTETAHITLRAAMTGHLVLATLHTNDTTSTVSRLMDMGVENYLIAATLRGVLSQRLVRKTCEHCKVDHVPDERERAWLSNFSGDMRIPKVFKRGEGCNHCYHSGFHGRVGVFELLEISPAMIEALRLGNNSEFINLATTEKTSRSLFYSAIDTAMKGLTSLSEVMALVGDIREKNAENGPTGDHTKQHKAAS